MSLVIQSRPPSPPVYVCVTAVISVTSMQLDSVNALLRCRAFLRMLGVRVNVDDVVECLERIAEVCEWVVRREWGEKMEGGSSGGEGSSPLLLPPSG